jgi:tetratricopeptide (TPR) repeat protein
MVNDADPFEREKALFDEALQHSAGAARSDFLGEACGSNQALRDRIEALLFAFQSAGGFLPTRVASPLSDSSKETTFEPLGSHIGRYKLLEKIGEGGCGVVYMAEQEEPVRGPTSSWNWSAASEDHRVLRPGTTFHPGPADLFIKVCQAIQHAHQKGIIHRDIKPSNILVTLHDGVPVPKVIDFGIAKATEGRLTDKTVFTQFQQFIGTPAYMSPEQAEMSGLDIDTRSDIYSLGVLLYELLAGQHALRRQGTDAGGSMRCAASSVKGTRAPARPLARWKAGNSHDGEASDRRHIDVGITGPPTEGRPRLDRDEVPGEGPHGGTRRRTSLAERIWSVIWRMRTRRRASATIALTYYSLGLQREAVPLAEKIVEYRRAALGREHSETLLAMNLRALCYHHSGRSPKAVELQEEVIALFEKTRPPEDRLALMAKGNLATFHTDMGHPDEAIRMYEALLPVCRKVQGSTGAETIRTMHNLAMAYNDVGRREEAIQLQEEVLRHIQHSKGPEHPETISGMQNLAVSYSGSDSTRREQAMKLREEVLVLARKVFGKDHPAMHNAIQNMVDSYTYFGRYAEAERLLTEALEATRKGHTNSPRSVTYYLTELADLQARYLKNYPAAYAFHQELLQDSLRRFSPGHDEYEEKVIKPSASLAAMLADWAYAERRNPAARARAYEAEQLMREALTVRQKRTNATAWKTSEWNTRLGSALLSIAVADSDLTPEAREKKFIEAEHLLLRGNEAVQESPAPDRQYKRETLERLVRLYESWGQPERAVPFRVKLKEFQIPPYPAESTSTVKATP